MAAAKRRGKRIGRPRTVVGSDTFKIERMREGGTSYRAIAAEVAGRLETDRRRREEIVAKTRLLEEKKLSVKSLEEEIERFDETFAQRRSVAERGRLDAYHEVIAAIGEELGVLPI